jgi:hypothetical protein
MSDFAPVKVHQNAWTPDRDYAPANPAWVQEFYETTFRPELSEHLVRWDDGFDCNKFSALFAARAQIEYYKQAFHRLAPQAIAIGECWTKDHSLVLIQTRDGEIYFEPQSGQFILIDPLTIRFRRY